MRFGRDENSHAPPELAVRAMGWLGLAGGLLAVLTIALPPAAEGSERLVLLTGACSIALGALLLIRMPKLREGELLILSIFGTTLITVATREGGLAGGAADNEILYLWVTFYAFYFLTLPNAFLQTAFVGAAYGWVLTSQAVGDTGVTQWLVTMSSLFVAGLITAQLRGNLYRRVGALSERASRDELTGLHNRGALEERYTVERARALRDKSILSLLAIDIDEFKELNDTLGHPTGDRALKQVSAALHHWTREIDGAARVGGDEFAVLLPGARPGDAIAIAEDVRTAIARSPLSENVRITVSIGVTSSVGLVPPLGELWQAADAAMYEAKRSGGDRVRFRGVHERAGERPPSIPLGTESAVERLTA